MRNGLWKLVSGRWPQPTDDENDLLKWETKAEKAAGEIYLLVESDQRVHFRGHEVLELPHGNCAGLILRYDNALCFLVPLLSLYDIMPHVAYFIIPWNKSRDRGSD